jgi:predicted  nucleic acid-binding Zn-ribbon protein
MTGPAHFKLYEAALCCECDEVFERGPRACPSCTCTQFLYLSSILAPRLNRTEIDKGRTVAAFDEEYNKRVLRQAV